MVLSRICLEKSQQQKNQVQGVNIPGIPFIMIGRNQYTGWGLTNNICDNSDFYQETIRNNSEYLFDGKWIKLKSRIEKIKIKGEKNLLNFTIHETHHGPILKGLFHLLDTKNWQNFQNQVSLSWIGFLEQDYIFEGLLGLQDAQNIDNIQNSIFLMKSPALNIVWATIDNHIGYQAQGLLPKRNFQGNVFIKNGSNPYNDWIGYYNNNEQPRVIDPQKGFIVTANNKVARNDFKKWNWGNVHNHRFDHKPFSQSLLWFIFERSYIGQGNKRTINVGGVNHIPDKWDSWYTANFRMILDFQGIDNSWWVIDTGVSENPFSNFYDDQMKLHEVGEYLKMKFRNGYNNDNEYQQEIVFGEF
ncbi:penicillin amidase family protein, putative [Ichthyophthirius multifiliis]|uniref:Penicillin amidase family protein, putative n=1 Tax=Ichthyophthirius multifiliis TaxID=5932 RepID=G0QS38_ICHMU|nr:penicillin amidase family protein, putative [Ichthyophthirius multifiliis]EGR31980.1 penicillin amidase family protein, putative [Ichthyophthirius multifiliis]|eukprot:XP_004035466.1 penicillin amidase family protein, putative [Ichthyophthirius multifiliis]